MGNQYSNDVVGRDGFKDCPCDLCGKKVSHSFTELEGEFVFSVDDVACIDTGVKVTVKISTFGIDIYHICQQCAENAIQAVGKQFPHREDAKQLFRQQRYEKKADLEALD